jgi:hypothetical protein
MNELAFYYLHGGDVIWFVLIGIVLLNVVACGVAYLIVSRFLDRQSRRKSDGREK